MNNKKNSFNQNEYNNNYKKTNYDRITILAKNGKKKEIETHIADFGYKSVTSFINEAIDEKITRDFLKLTE